MWTLMWFWEIWKVCAVIKKLVFALHGYDSVQHCSSNNLNFAKIYRFCLDGCANPWHNFSLQLCKHMAMRGKKKNSGKVLNVLELHSFTKCTRVSLKSMCRFVKLAYLEEGTLSVFFFLSFLRVYFGAERWRWSQSWSESSINKPFFFLLLSAKSAAFTFNSCLERFRLNILCVSTTLETTSEST